MALFSCISAKYQINVVQQRGDETTLRFTMSNADFQLLPLNSNGESCTRILLQDAAYDQEKGCPDLPHVAQSIIIPDLPKMKLEIVSVQFYDIAVQTIAPSKGSFSRNINPADVPSVFGEPYKIDSWFPSQCANLGDPYIVRDFRANVVYFLPFLYNPKTSILRVNTGITVKVSPTAQTGINCKYRTAPAKICPDFDQIYSRRLINYPAQQRYTPVDEAGSMLIISPASYIETMKPFVDWKNKRGIKTEIVDIQTVGTATASIKTYVADYYKTNSLKYLLLIGDNDQVVSSASSGDPSDNKYGCIEGTDSYVEVFVGRFSGTTAEHIKTQIDKTLYYERKLKTTDTWLCNGMGTASGSETDDVNAINHIITDMKSFTYTTVSMYKNSSDNTSVVADVNKGLSYHPNSSHGTKTSLNNLRVSDVANMTNANKYPYNYTLACDPGSFTSGTDCLGEALLKKSGGGYVGAFMASISQPWYPPYAAIKEQADILCEKCPAANIKRTYGGIAHNGCMKMIDDYKSEGPWVSDCWVLFGDPSLLIYTATPKPITIQHPASVGTGSQQVTVTGTDSATVCLYSKPQNIQQVKKLVGGTATFSMQVTTKDSIYVTATKFNHETYEGAIVTGTSGAFTNDKQYNSKTFCLHHSNGMVQFIINAPSAKKSLTIYDCLGNLVYADNQGEIEPWRFENRCGTNAASGIYFVVLELKNSNTTVQLHRTIAGLK